MFAILGEDQSDVEMLCTLVRRIAKTPNLPIKKMGYMGCAELLIKGAKQVKAYSKIGCNRFIICYDSDRSKPSDRHATIVEKIIKKSEVNAEFCALVPVQEIESWILADLPAVTNIISSWKPEKNIPNPELQVDPKEYLEKLSRNEQHKPRYSHAIHNQKVAAYISLKDIVNKCPSSLPLFELVQTGTGNHPLPKYLSDSQRRKNIIAAL